MSNLQFKKATKEQARLRLALFGPSGSGKTYSALRIAAGLGGSIAVIDTERGSASKYADRFEFDVLELETRNITTYRQAIEAANQAGYNVLIIDSLTHAWQELLADIDKIAKGRYGGNRWSAWSDGTPMQNNLIDTLLTCNCHIIATMRSKTEWAVQQDEKGKVKPVRMGLAPEQGKGIEYEFDMLMEISPDHSAVIIKDRTGKYQDEMIELPDEEFGTALANWLSDGAAPQPRQDDKTEKYRARWNELTNEATVLGIQFDKLPENAAPGRIIEEGQKLGRLIAIHKERADLWEQYEQLYQECHSLGIESEYISIESTNTEIKAAVELLKNKLEMSMSAVTFDPTSISPTIHVNEFYALVIETVPHYKHKNHIINAWKLIQGGDAQLCNPDGTLTMNPRDVWTLLKEHADAHHEEKVA